MLAQLEQPNVGRGQEVIQPSWDESSLNPFIAMLTGQAKVFEGKRHTACTVTPRQTSHWTEERMQSTHFTLHNRVLGG